jgi:transposase IS66 family protein
VLRRKNLKTTESQLDEDHEPFFNSIDHSPKRARCSWPSAGRMSAAVLRDRYCGRCADRHRRPGGNQHPYAIEAEIRGRSPDESGDFDNLKAWFETKLAMVSQKSTIAEAIRYALTRWEGLCRFIEWAGTRSLVIAPMPEPVTSRNKAGRRVPQTSGRHLPVPGSFDRKSEDRLVGQSSNQWPEV